MELDDLKDTWKQSQIKGIKNTNIMELIHNKNYGPVAALKKSFKKQIKLMIILPAILLTAHANDMSKVFTSILFWSYVAFCIGMIIFSFSNYRIVSKMQRMDGMVKSNLEQHINLLETRLRWHIIGVRIVLLFFVVLAETVPYFQQYSMLNKWHSLPVAIRFSAYAVLFILQYFLSRRISYRKFGGHLAYLKELVNEM